MAKNFTKRHHTVAAILTCLVGTTASLLFMVYTVRANSEPTLVDVKITTSSLGAHATAVNLTEDTTTKLYIHAAVTEPDGCADLDSSSIAGKFYRIGVTETCTDNPLNCYDISSSNCSLVGCSGAETDVNVQCEVNVQHFADATDLGDYEGEAWFARLEIADMSASTTNATSESTEVNSLVALTVVDNPSIPGAAPSSTSIGDGILRVRNSGNTQIDGNFSGSEMTCSVSGAIPVEQIRYSVLPGQGYDSMTAVSSSAERVDISLAKQTTADTSSTAALYFKIRFPDAIGGTCDGTLTIDALSD